MSKANSKAKIDSKRNGSSSGNYNESKPDKSKDFKIVLAAMTSPEDFSKLKKKLNGVLVNA